MLPTHRILDGAQSQFPFVIHGFHSDNGSESLNQTVARLLNKLDPKRDANAVTIVDTLERIGKTMSDTAAAQRIQQARGCLHSSRQHDGEGQHWRLRPAAGLWKWCYTLSEFKLGKESSSRTAFPNPSGSSFDWKRLNTFQGIALAKSITESERSYGDAICVWPNGIHHQQHEDGRRYQALEKAGLLILQMHEIQQANSGFDKGQHETHGGLSFSWSFFATCNPAESDLLRLSTLMWVPYVSTFIVSMSLMQLELKKERIELAQGRHLPVMRSWPPILDTFDEEVCATASVCSHSYHCVRMLVGSWTLLIVTESVRGKSIDDNPRLNEGNEALGY
jgi:hypothetical protein